MAPPHAAPMDVDETHDTTDACPVKTLLTIDIDLPGDETLVSELTDLFPESVDSASSDSPSSQDWQTSFAVLPTAEESTIPDALNEDVYNAMEEVQQFPVLSLQPVPAASPQFGGCHTGRNHTTRRYCFGSDRAVCKRMCLASNYRTWSLDVMLSVTA
eukprot:m.380745 g.380745  ORF g.380745 m.380745 type:complete len:158 (-) comp16712_c2_seq2:2819-3292(-)